MKELFTGKRVKKLREAEDYIYYGIKMSADENEELAYDIKHINSFPIISQFEKDNVDELKRQFKHKYGVNKDEIEAYGSFSLLDDKSEIMKLLIEKKEGKVAGEKTTYYTCFGTDADEAIKKRGIAIHQDPSSSFECFLSVMAYPKYLCILKIKKDEIIQKRFY